MARFSLFATLIALLLSPALAIHLPGFEKRQNIQPGTPLYNCHEVCGEVILISKTSNFCSNSTFTSDLNSCLDCALTYNIWKYYGSDVKSAAEECNDDATPSPSSATSTAVATATATGSEGDSSPASSKISTASETAASGAVSTTATATGAATVIRQDGVLPIAMGLLAWILAL